MEAGHERELVQRLKCVVENSWLVEKKCLGVREEELGIVTKTGRERVSAGLLKDVKREKHRRTTM